MNYNNNSDTLRSVSIALIGISVLLVVSLIISQAVEAKQDHIKKGNYGKCKKLQDTFPPELRDYQGCKDSYTGKNHGDDEPLP